MKKSWLWWVLAVIFVWLLVSREAEVRQVWTALRAGRAAWIGLAALLQIAFYVAYAGIYQTSLHAVGVDCRLRGLIPVMFASLALNIVAPGVGPALFVDHAGRRGQSPARAAAGAVLVRVADFSTFAVILVAGMVYLFRHHALRTHQILGAVGLVAVIGGWTLLLLLGLVHPVLLARLLSWVRRLANWASRRLRRPPPLDEEWPDRTTLEYAAAARTIMARPARLVVVLAVATVAHLVDLASLYVLFVAFGVPTGLGELVAGFAVALLFWIVAVTPQGIGVVEGAMALAYTSLGVPAAQATAIALAFRGLTFWVPTALGFVLLNRVGGAVLARGAERPRRLPHYGAGERAVHVLAWGAAIVGLVNLISAVTPALGDRLNLIEPYLPAAVRHGGHYAAAVSGFFLLLLARGLGRRKSAAWAVSVTMLIVAIVSHLIKGLDYEETLLAAGLLAGLVALRPSFHARSDRWAVRQGLLALLAAFAFTLLYGTAGFYLLDRHYQTIFQLGPALRQTVVMFTAFYDPGLEPLTGFGRYFADSIYAIAALTLSYALMMLVRPVFLRDPASPAERALARAIVERHGRSALARFNLFDDKAYWFSEGGSVVAFVAKGGIALALGDPIGPPEDASAAVRGFANHCIRNDWRPAFYEVPADLRVAYESLGLHLLCIGHDAVVPLADFSLAGQAGRSLRPAINKLTRLGYAFRLHEPPLPPLLLARLREVSDEWLTIHHGNEKRFSLGWFDQGYLTDCAVGAIYDSQAEIVAFANLVPEYQRNEATIDLMRHRAEVENGTMDLLFVRLLEWAQQQDYETFNLGLSSLAGVGERPADPAAEKALRFIFEHVNRFYNFKGLHHFKAKYHPRWEPRYLVHPGLASLPAVWSAIMRANGGDDFLAAYRRR